MLRPLLAPLLHAKTSSALVISAHITLTSPKFLYNFLFISLILLKIPCTSTYIHNLLFPKFECGCLQLNSNQLAFLGVPVFITSMATKVQALAKPVSEQRAILGPTGNRVRASEDPKRKTEVAKKPQRPIKPASRIPEPVIRNNGSVDSSCSSDSSSSTASPAKKIESSRRTVTVKRKNVKNMKIVPDNSSEIPEASRIISEPIKRCDWITPNSDPLYISFHDEEWGVPVYDNRKLFELLVFSQALAELSWPAILNKRDIFRKLFDNFEISSIAQFTEKRLLSLKVNGSLLLSEPKLRAIVENAKQMLKVQQQFGSFSNYCWSFVNHAPVRNGFRYARQVPVKTPKAELISKDLMQRGFRCVGPTVVYSFMQVSGMVNDHLLRCFRYQECNANPKNDLKPKI
ncbi:putative DNA-3-methyladenine glycosylase [Melia azedarach]|uniref:DNA-3-methyladenine glycosylase n=1 Tax=Melia azedarach TaxID=155640 RepID=A0ACC1WSA4_MELAZ|nr:putative DNA-3-methyladenine glycosylase [Melia azedarach]